MKILVIACGTGVATSTLINEEVSELLEERGISVYIIQCKLSEIEGYIDGADLILTSMNVEEDYGKPVLTALPLLTDVGRAELEERIIGYLS